MSYSALGYNDPYSSVAVGWMPRKMQFSPPKTLTPNALEAIRNELPQPIAEAIEEANAEPRPPDGAFIHIGGGQPGKRIDYWYDDDDDE